MLQSDAMKPTPNNPLAALAGWSPLEKRQLWAALTNELAAGTQAGIVQVMDDKDTAVAYVIPAHDAATEYGAEWSVAYLLELQRRAATLSDSAPRSDVRGRLASGLGL